MTSPPMARWEEVLFDAGAATPETIVDAWARLALDVKTTLYIALTIFYKNIQGGVRMTLMSTPRPATHPRKSPPQAGVRSSPRGPISTSPGRVRASHGP